MFVKQNPVREKINEPELRKDFEGFCRRMRIKCTSEIIFHLTLVKIPNGRPLELAESLLYYSSFLKEKRQAMRLQVDNRSVVIKKAESSVV